MNIFTQAELVTKIHLLNGIWGKKNGLDTKGIAKEPTPTKPSKIQQFFDENPEMFDCQRSNVAKLITMMTGERIRIKVAHTEKVDVVRGIMLVPTTPVEEAGHNYELGHSILSTDPNHPQFQNSAGWKGNVLNTQRKYLRLATKAEITKFVAEWEEHDLPQAELVIKLSRGMEDVNGA